MRSDVEETGTQKTKDSGYSNSSNSQSQGSSGSSKSRNSTSSGSSDFRPNQSEGEKTKRGKEKKKKDVPQISEQPQLREEPKEPGAEVGCAALTHTLASISRIQSSLPSPDGAKWCEPLEVDSTNIENEELAHLMGMEGAHEEELGIVMSMKDGLVIYTTPSICNMLGYPKDMWVGRSLIDFVHPHHRASFAGHITSVIASNDQDVNGKQNQYMCYMREYRGLKSTGFSVTDKWVGYLPLQLSIRFKGTEKESPKMFLLISAILVRSAYTHADETSKSTKFTTRHTSSSQLCHVDYEVTPYFGYLPQDILGRSILEFYHPEDLHFLKEVYEAVMKEQGHLFRSKPYRFRCQNGGFALVETELSAFINPWTRKLEFIICQHTVLRGPPNPDVTTPVAEPEALKISEEVLKETKIVREEIKCLLNETSTRSCETAKQQISRRCKDLAVFMATLVDEMTKKPPNLKVDVPTEEQSISERDSVMLGEISPHHDYYDSKSSSETPPSYNQLNYNENLLRFFESKPKTSMSDDSTESKMANGGEEGKISPVIESIGDTKSGGSGGSTGAQSTETNGNSGETIGSNTNASNNCNSFKPAALTEQLLTRHNEDMEKQMVQKHREQRTKSDTKVKDRMKNSDKAQNESSATQGIKRCGSHSWEGEPHKAIKAEHNKRDSGPNHSQAARHEAEKQQNAFPLFAAKQDFKPAGYASPLVPLYYLANRRPDAQHAPVFSQQGWKEGNYTEKKSQSSSSASEGWFSQPESWSPTYERRSQSRLGGSSGFSVGSVCLVPYVPSVVYQPLMFSPQPVVYSPLTMVPGHDLPPPDIPRPSQNHSPSQGPNHMKPTQEPSTSSYHNKESSKNQVQDQKTESNETSIPFDDSSSSFYSLLKTDKSDESMRSSSENDTKQDVAPWIEEIKVTPELILKYQLRDRPLSEVLSQDLKALASICQPELVTEQLSQMYLDLEAEGVPQQLEVSSSSSESDLSKELTNPRRRYMKYDSMEICYEGDAPLPPPLLQPCT